MHAYLRAQSFDWGAVESLGAAAILPTHTSALGNGNGPLSEGKDTDGEGFSGLLRDLAVALTC